MPTPMTSTGSTALVRISPSQGALIAWTPADTGSWAVAHPQSAGSGRRAIALMDYSERTSAPDALTRHVTAVWARLVAWRMRRATRIILNSLDDRILKDIGLERSGIDSILRDMPRW